MELEIFKDNFQKAINVCERITKKAVSLPILQNVLLKTNNSFLEITTTNLEVNIVWNVLAKINQKGSLLINASFLNNILNLTTSEKVIIKQENGNLVLLSDGQETQIQGQPVEEFPVITNIEKEYKWQMDSLVLADGLARVAPIAAFSSVRPEIAGVYFSFQKNKLKLVATDSFRLAEKTILLNSTKQSDFQDACFIVPQYTCQELIGILNQEKGVVEIATDLHQVLFEIKGERYNELKCCVQGRLINGEYPKYEEILPQSYKTRVRLNKDVFTNRLKGAGLFSSKIFDVKIDVLTKEGKIKLFSQNASVGRNEYIWDCVAEGQNESVVFNYKFLLDGLNNIKSPDVFFELNGFDGPGVLRPDGDNSYFYVLMPIKQ